MTILNQIIEHKRIEVAMLKDAHPLEGFENEIRPSDRSFYDALKLHHPAFILECKQSSPSKGLMKAHFDLDEIAKAYTPFASAISVLTDQKFFSGNFGNLEKVRSIVTQPVLCKDFIIDPYQIHYARYHGADAVLLMLSVLNDESYRSLSKIAHDLNMGVLTEVSNDTELERALTLNPKVIGINNRDLRDLSIDLSTTERLAQKIPESITVISESGITNHEVMRSLSPFADGFLIGSALMQSDELTVAIRKMIFGEHKVCGIRSIEIAKVAYDSGAVYGGLIFVNTSPRAVTEEIAKEITDAVPLKYIGVFQNDEIHRVVEIATTLNLFAVQLHGSEDVAYIETLRSSLPLTCQIWKAIDASKEICLECYPNSSIDRYVFDYQSGGTGCAFDWNVLKNIEVPFMLAGGIQNNNVNTALKQGALGVDINSGVEIFKGEKSPHKIKEIFNTIRTFNKE